MSDITEPSELSDADKMTVAFETRDRIIRIERAVTAILEIIENPILVVGPDGTVRPLYQRHPQPPMCK